MFKHISLPCELPKLKRIDENGTRKYLTPTGEKYPSITTILAEYNRKAITEWRLRVGYDNAIKISNKASSRGTKFHSACEDYLNNKVPTFTNPLQVDSFNSFKPILHNINNIYAQELQMFSDTLRVAGTVDCIAEYEGVLSVIDFKTASKPKKKENIENYFMQCSAYAIMFEELFGIEINQIVVPISVQDETPQIFVEQKNNYIERLKYFRELYDNRVVAD
jgi:genome maintenance exonuclease 1